MIRFVAIFLSVWLGFAGTLAGQEAWTESEAQTESREQAELAFAQGKLPDALKHWENHIWLGPSRFGYLHLTRVLLAGEYCEEAARTLQRASTAPDGPPIKDDPLSTMQQALERELATQCSQFATPEILYATGQALFQERKWAKAAMVFTIAADKDPSPVLLYNAARSYEYAGDLESAVRQYRAALEMKPGDELTDRIERTLERLANLRETQEAKEESALGLLDIRSVPAGAIVYLDGTVVGQTPYQGTHATGEFEVTLEKDGYGDFDRDVTLEAGKEIIIDAALLPSERYWTWWTMGATGAALAGGVITGTLSQRALEDARAPASLRDQERLDETRDRGRFLATTSIALYVGALVGAGLTTWLWFEEAPLSRPAESAIIITPQGIGFSQTW